VLFEEVSVANFKKVISGKNKNKKLWNLLFNRTNGTKEKYSICWIYFAQ